MEVCTAIFPEVRNGGTVTVRLVAVAAVTTALIPLKNTLLRDGEGSNFVPLIVMAVPVTAVLGLNPLIVGGPEVSSANCWVLVTDPEGDCTKIAPPMAPESGISTTIWVWVEDTTVAEVPEEPANLTVFCEGVGLKPAP